MGMKIHNEIFWFMMLSSLTRGYQHFRWTRAHFGPVYEGRVILPQHKVSQPRKLQSIPRSYKVFFF